MTDAYDLVAYPGNAFQDTHPDRLSTIAFLHGMDPAPADRCRVLELGTGSGGNIIPLACAYPDSTFLGIDRAATAIEDGRQTIRSLGLENIRLEAMDLLEAKDLGTFDYIITHGVFSWVPEEVRQRILTISKQNLAPQGVAFISYLALPGTHVRNVFRDAMLFHTRRFEAPMDRVRQARAIARIMADAPGEDPFKVFARSVVADLAEWDDAVVFHDYLAEFNDAFYFIQFIEHAARHGLQFLSEAEYPAGFVDTEQAPDNVRAAVAALESNVVLREQYYDFMRCRRFRQTLLVHNDVRLQRPAIVERVLALHAASRVKPRNGEPDLQAGVVVSFGGEGAAGIHTSSPVGKAALLLLGRSWPKAVIVRELLEQARELARSTSPIENDTLALLTILLRCYERGHVELWRHQPSFTMSPGERPEASPVARELLRRGRRRVPTFTHVMLGVEDDLGAELILRLDGTRDRAALIDDLTNVVVSGRAKLEVDGRALTDPQEIRREIEGGLEARLQHLAGAALFVS